MQVPVVAKKYNYNSTDTFLQKVVQVISILNGIELPIGAIALVGYYMRYGINPETEAMFTANRKATSRWYVYNLRVDLKKNKALIKNEETEKWELNSIYSIPIKDCIGFKILLQQHEFKTGS